jgi:hypothetical protein
MRSIAEPFIAAQPTGARIRTRLRLSAWDEAVVRMVGEHLGRLAGQDLAARCRLGVGDDQRAARKRALTPLPPAAGPGRSPAPQTTSGNARSRTCWTPESGCDVRPGGSGRAWPCRPVRGRAGPRDMRAGRSGLRSSGASSTWRPSWQRWRSGSPRGAYRCAALAGQLGHHDLHGQGQGGVVAAQSTNWPVWWETRTVAPTAADGRRRGLARSRRWPRRPAAVRRCR